MSAASASTENFSQAELDKFGALAQRWWDPEGPQKALHALNPARLGYVADRVKLPHEINLYDMDTTSADVMRLASVKQEIATRTAGIRSTR